MAQVEGDEPNTYRVSTGLKSLDGLLSGLLPGDNVVWIAANRSLLAQIEDAYFNQALANGHPCTYVTVLTPPTTLVRRLGRQVTVLDARRGQALASPELLEQALVGRARTSPLECMVIDSLDTLVARWGAKSSLSFFSRVCLELFTLGAVTYWRVNPTAIDKTFMEEVRHAAQCVMAVSENDVQILKADGHPQEAQGKLIRSPQPDGRSEVRTERALDRLSRGLERLRKSHNLTQTGLARLAGVTPSAVSQAEAGRRGLSIDTLLVIAEKLHVRLDDLFCAAAEADYLVVRKDVAGTRKSVRTLFDDPSTGLRAVLVWLGPGQAGTPPWRHKGPQFVAVLSGLVQFRLAAEAPVLRAGDTMLSLLEPIETWRSLLPAGASLYWVVRDT